MSVELLWIIPIIAVAMAGLIIFLSLTKTSNAGAAQRDLKKEVTDYNLGKNIETNLATQAAEMRLREMEGTISLVMQALSNQQKIIENFQGKDLKLENEVQILSKRLSELQQEYDITLSENYSLKSKLKTIDTQKDKKNVVHSQHQEVQGVFKDQDLIESKKTTYLKVIPRKASTASKFSDFDDTSEIDIDTIK